MLQAHIAAYELAYQHASAAPDLVDLRDESQATMDMYGMNHKSTRSFGSRCLLARRMIERGVRLVKFIRATRMAGTPTAMCLRIIPSYVKPPMHR